MTNRKRILDVFATAIAAAFISLLIYRVHFTGWGKVAPETSRFIRETEQDLHLKLVIIVLLYLIVPASCSICWLIYRIMKYKDNERKFLRFMTLFGYERNLKQFEQEELEK